MPTGFRHRRARARVVVAGIVCAAGLALASCHAPPPPPSNVTPDKALATSLRLTATGDFDALVKNRLPPADYAQWRREWDKARAQRMPPTLAEQQQFAQVMQMLTAPGAEAKLAARLKPELARLKDGTQSSLPILAGIVQASGKSLIAASLQLAPSQRVFATQILEAVLAWARSADLGSAHKADKAIAILCKTARALNVKTLAQWRALDYATSMRDYGIVWRGLEEMLAVYGLDAAGSLDDAKIARVAGDDGQATVRVDLKLAGQVLTAEWIMRSQDGHWYDGALLDAWRRAHPAAAATVAAPAHAASVAPHPAPAASAAR